MAELGVTIDDHHKDSIETAVLDEIYLVYIYICTYIPIHYELRLFIFLHFFTYLGLWIMSAGFSETREVRQKRMRHIPRLLVSALFFQYYCGAARLRNINTVR